MEKVIIYTQSACGYCKTVKDELTKKNIEFEEKLIDNFQSEWNTVVNLTSLPTTPTIYYKKNYFIAGRDFPSPEVLINILRNFVSTGEVNSFKVLENIKTLNYNMATAFRRLDQLLKTIEQKIDKL